MVWGGRRLAEILGKSMPDSTSPYGESWEVSDHPMHESVVAAGPRAGESIRRLMEQDRADLVGPSARSPLTTHHSPLTAPQRFPWLIKFLDANDWLSVQVHPDEKAVAKFWPGEGSKTEAWFIIDAVPGSRIYAGLLSGVDERQLRSALAAGQITGCLHSFEPRPGDCVFLPAGTVHAVGGGVLLAEVQQTSDATFRLFDWNRRDSQGKSRPLHIEESMASIHWEQGPVNPVRVDEFRKASGPAIKRDLVRCPYFELTYQISSEPVSLGGQGRLQALIVLQGRGRWHGSSCSEEVNLGQVWVLPASLPPFECRPNPTLTMLLATLP